MTISLEFDHFYLKVLGNFICISIRHRFDFRSRILSKNSIYAKIAKYDPLVISEIPFDVRNASTDLIEK